MVDHGGDGGDDGVWKAEAGKDGHHNVRLGVLEHIIWAIGRKRNSQEGRMRGSGMLERKVGHRNGPSTRGMAVLWILGIL